MEQLDSNAVSRNLQQALRLLLAGGLIEQTVPDRTRSRFPRYRLASKGRNALKNLGREGSRF